MAPVPQESLVRPEVLAHLEAPADRPAPRMRFLQRAINIVEEHIDDFEFSVETFVEQMHLGRTPVNKKLKALTNLSAVQFIRSSG